MAIEDLTHKPDGIAVPPGNYWLDPARSTVAFTARKLGLFTIKGTMGLASGEFAVGNPPERSSVHAVLAADTFTTPMVKRDEHVKGVKLLDVARYPVIEFVSREVVPVDGHWEVRGTLSVHGVAAPAALVLRAATLQGSGAVRISATAEVNRRAFGVTALRLAASSRITLQIEAVGTPVC